MAKFNSERFVNKFLQHGLQIKPNTVSLYREVENLMCEEEFLTFKNVIIACMQLMGSILAVDLTVLKSNQTKRLLISRYCVV